MIRATMLVGVLVTAVIFAACADDDDDDPRVPQIGSLAEAATYAYADAEAEGLYDYVASNVSDACTAEALAEDLADRETPTDWKQVRDVQFGGEDRATATVVVIVGTEEKDEDWSFVEEDGAWRIADLPGLDECAGGS